MYLTGPEQRALRSVLTLLAEDQSEREIRERTGWALLNLPHADQFASFVWDADSGTFGGRRRDFSDHEKVLLDLIEPTFAGALQRDAHRSALAQSFGKTDTEAAWLQLSLREREVAKAVCEGLTDKEFARRMALGVPTVRTYLRRIFVKLGIERRAALAGFAAPARAR